MVLAVIRTFQEDIAVSVDIREGAAILSLEKMVVLGYFSSCESSLSSMRI